MDNRTLFGKMCRDVLDETYALEMASNTESARCSHNHYKRVSRILGVPVREKAPKAKFLVLLIAAALLFLSACTYTIYTLQGKTWDDLRAELIGQPTETESDLDRAELHPNTNEGGTEYETETQPEIATETPME